MSDASADHRKGLAIAALGGLVLTIDIPLIRLADGEPWSVLMLRSGATFAVAVLLWGVLSLRAGKPRQLIPGRVGLAVAALYAMSASTFMMAVFHTTTANLVFILALNPMLAALLSWAFLKERPRPATFVAITLMAVGVLIIVGEGIRAGHWFGDLLALSTALFTSSAITIARGSGKDMGFTAISATIVPFLVAAAVVSVNGFEVAVPWWILLNGTIVIPTAFFCLAISPKYIPGPEVAMFYLLETVLAPVWIWMIFSEVPSLQSAVGGAILIVTLVAHSLWQLHAGRGRRAAAIRRPF